ncbi:MAG TPA: hypothetical protein VMJ32_06510 [Pirellulales bacterium]|nr:hypothetical protein [Pirellulales bacterium]
MVDALGRLIQVSVVSFSLTFYILLAIAFFAAKRNPVGAAKLGQKAVIWLFRKLV